MPIGRKLKILRVVHGYEQQELADMVKIQSQQSYGRIENNVREPSADELHRLAKIYKLTSEQIYAWDVDKTSTYLVANIVSDSSEAGINAQMKAEIDGLKERRDEQQKIYDNLKALQIGTAKALKSAKGEVDYWKGKAEDLDGKLNSTKSGEINNPTSWWPGTDMI